MSRIYEFDYDEQSKALKTRLDILTLNRIRIAYFISKIHRTQLAGKIRIKCPYWTSLLGQTNSFKIAIRQNSN